ncbi:PIN domain-containing protein, partial [uncultured Methylobacterium sp.]|uniref:PIN domain-containing protein n=1 Tax=uncultured Methylobacterium sp. TaxID=157278 RepID=UPI0035C9BA94
DLPLRFDGRLLGIDEVTADVWGRLMVQAQHRGRPISAMDGFIAATACRHGLSLVTRNSKDFEALDIPLLNPWQA